MERTGETTPRRTRLLAAVVLVATFLAGGLAGAGLQHALHGGHGGHGGHEMADERPLPPPLRGLDLTEEQERQVREVVDRYHPRMEAVMRQTWPVMKPVFDEMAVEIKALLEPGQQAQFEAKRQEMERRRFGEGRQP